MDKDRTENFESPLDEVFDDLPQENPPKDLHHRCVTALDEIDAERGSLSAPRWYAPLRNVIATAAVLVLAVGLFTLLPLFMSAERAAPIVARLSSEKPVQTAAGRPLAQPGQPVSKVATGPGMAPGMPGPAPTPPVPEVTEQTEAQMGSVDYFDGTTEKLSPPATANSQRGWIDYRIGLESTVEWPEEERADAEGDRAADGQAFGERHTEWASRPSQSGTGIDYFDARMPAESQPPHAPEAPEPVVRERIALQTGEPPRPVTLGHPASRPSQPPQAPQVEEPWRDLSGGRQVVVDKELELEVKDVEKSYDEARLIVEKHGGFVASDEISVDAHALDTAVLTIRLPKDGFEAAIAELRKLGTVLKLVGESQDVTQQYFSQGAEIRSRADREQMLVEKYEKETNARKKRQLKDEIEQLRREMRREKEILTKLAEETHWPTLQLTLKERGGPAGFLSEMLERSGRALAWVGATAIIWVPLVVLLTLFWGRLRRTSQ